MFPIISTFPILIGTVYALKPSSVRTKTVTVTNPEPCKIPGIDGALFIRKDLFMGLAKMESSVKILLDIDKVLNREELSLLSKAA